VAAKGEKNSFDYANDMLLQCVKGDPNNLVYVETFLANLQKKYNNNKRGGGSGGNRGAFKKAVSKKEWNDVLKLGPELLAANPWDVSTLRPMADACAAFGFNEIELRYLKNALDANPKDIAVNKHCATTLARVGQFDQAIAIWTRIGEMRKNDPEPDKMISELTLQKTRVMTGLGTDDRATGKVVNQVPTSAHAPVKEAPKPKPAEEKKYDIKLTPRQQLERAIAEDPTIPENYYQLADLLLAENRAGEAVQLLQKALAVTGGNLQVQQRLEDAQLQQMRMHIAVAEKRAATEKTPEAAQLVEQLKEQMHRRELEVYANRVERHPQDARLKFEFGQRLKKVGNYVEAEKIFMAARENPELKPAATIEVGECLQHQQKYNHAIQFYTRAIELTAQGDLNLRKLALYRGGLLAVGLRQFSLAEKWLTQLSQLDGEYRDVRARLDKLAQMRNKG
jgi:tetratricopeptide (TPR) repeat protein